MIYIIFISHAWGFKVVCVVLWTIFALFWNSDNLFITDFLELNRKSNVYVCVCACVKVVI